MPRNVSSIVRQAIYDQQTEKAFIALLTLDHPDLNSPLRFSSDGVDTVSNGDTYVSFPFRISLPQESKDTIPSVQLEIDNVSREIVSTIRDIDSNPTLEMEIVLSSDTDTVIAGPFPFELRDVNYDALTVQGTLSNPALDETSFPTDSFDPANFPGLFDNI